MLHPKDFLEEELENVTLSLKETLRYEYGALRSNNFYEECLFRLEVVKSQISIVDESDHKKLLTLALQLSNLSELITRIERSHLGEFSWSFANELEKLFYKVCQSEISDEVFNSPLFFISADGGLTSYRIHPEQEETDIIERRIFNIVFPRSLKHHVLLHSILGHELGHAAFAIPNLQEKIETKVITSLLQNSEIETTDKFQKWISRNYRELAGIDDELANDILKKWKEEFFCDLFGTTLMGPSFVSAHRSLLSAMDPGGLEVGLTHPPNITRYQLIDEIVKTRKFEVTIKKPKKQIDFAFIKFWKSLKPVKPYPKWTMMFDPSSVKIAVNELVAILNQHTPIAYRQESINSYKELYDRLCSAVPPINETIDEKLQISLNQLDFRKILYAGWLTWHTAKKERSELSYFEINRLCDRAILMQEAINLEIGKTSK